MCSDGLLHAHQLSPGSSPNHTVLGERPALIPFVTPLKVDVSMAPHYDTSRGGTSHNSLVGQNPPPLVGSTSDPTNQHKSF